MTNLEKHQKFWEKNLETQSGSGFNRTYFVIEELLPKSNASVLDVGCGFGHMEVVLNSNFMSNVVGLDISKRSVKHCAKRFPQYKFIQHDITKGLKMFDDNEFDLVILSEVTEHVPNPVFVLMECLRVGKEVIISMPNAFWNELRRKSYLELKSRIGSPEYVWFTYTSLENTLKELNTKILEERYFYGNFGLVRKISPKLLASRFIFKLRKNKT